MKNCLITPIYVSMLTLAFLAASPVAFSEDYSQANTQQITEAKNLYQEGKLNKAFQSFMRLAKQNDPRAQFNVGWMYFTGKGIQKDKKQALFWYTKAATNGVEKAMLNVAAIYQKGDVAEINNVKALFWYLKAAKKGNAKAQYESGKALALGIGTKKNLTEASKWYRKAAEQGVASAQFNLGVMYDKGQGVKQDSAEAAMWYRKAAEQGDADAQSNLGMMYDFGGYYGGGGVKLDSAEAAKWYRKAAVQGNVAAQFFLGLMYFNGQGVKHSAALAAKWYRRAAVQGNVAAQAILGGMYDEGQGVKQDYAKAAKWYRKAAEQGDADAQFILGLMYDKGQGVKKDYTKAAKWYRKAAEQGVASAQFNLGVMYGKGQGVKKDYAKAAKWYRKAAEQGYANAQFNLGVMYGNGEGVMRSGAAAADWYYKAGLSYLKKGSKEEVLQSVERIKRLTKALHLTVPNAFLADKLLARIYGGKGTAQSSPKTKQHKAASAVFGTGWPVVGGYVVTNHHVVAGHHHIVLVRRDGVKIKVTVVADDVSNDLALLKPASRKNLPPALPLANRPARVGEQVFTVGYPHPDLMGIEPKLTQGIVNARTGILNDPRTYQISVPLQGGNSGGPLVNMRGEVVGIVTAKLSAAKVFKWTGDMPQNVNYAIKSGYVRILLSSIDPASNVPVLPVRKDNLTGLAKRIEGSVLMVIAE